MRVQIPLRINSSPMSHQDPSGLDDAAKKKNKRRGGDEKYVLCQGHSSCTRKHLGCLPTVCSVFTRFRLLKACTSQRQRDQGSGCCVRSSACRSHIELASPRESQLATPGYWPRSCSPLRSCGVSTCTVRAAGRHRRRSGGIVVPTRHPEARNACIKLKDGNLARVKVAPCSCAD